MQRAPSDAPRGKDETNMPEPEYKDVFAKNLKHYMAVNGKNQTDLMRDLGFSSSTISNWCTGQKLPRIFVHLRVFAVFLRVFPVCFKKSSR